MHINDITIKNFRQMVDVQLSLDKGTTLLAGPNNSGKTTLTMLLKNILCGASYIIGIDDLPAIARKAFSSYIIEGIEGSTAILDNLIVECDFSPLELEVRIEIEYEEQDDIRYFADYIMDLDEGNKKLFFSYCAKLNQSKFETLLSEQLDKINTRLSSKNEEVARSMVLQIFTNSLENKCYFYDSSYENENEMDINKFKNLFNTAIIRASRGVSEYSIDAKHSLSEKLIKLASNDENWASAIETVQGDISIQISDREITEIVKKSATIALIEVIDEISKTSGNNIGRLNLGVDVKDDDIAKLLDNTIKAYYVSDNKITMNEASQGLGYSNLIFIHLELETFCKTIDPFRINLFIIEEPESHMHPQMQSVFAKYVLNKFGDKNIQGLITTHSNEIVRCSTVERLRVIRSVKGLKSRIFNLNEIASDSDISKKQINLLFEIGFSDLLFADRIILYEGDTERLYLKHIVSLDEYKQLQGMYIAFIQVGGAYAHNYKAIIEYLEIKSLIITDIDYAKSSESIEDVLKSKSTNAAINHFYEQTHIGKNDPTVQDLYEWEQGNDNVIHVVFQRNTDGYARTLEEAMLFKLLGKENVFAVHDDWKAIRDDCKLKFTIPKHEDGAPILIRDIVEASSDKKTDFMYSVILEGKGKKLLPKYIEGGLTWLMK